MKTIVCLGDSITYGYDNGSKMNNFTQVKTPYPAKLEQLLGEGYKVINSGNTGWQARGIYKELDNLVYKHNPDTAILMLGINDARGSKQGLPVTRKNYYNYMRKIVVDLQLQGIEVLLLSPTPVFHPRVKQFNKVAIKLANEYGLKYIDMHWQINNQLSKDNLTLKQVLSDRVHLTQDYYIKLAEIVFINFDL